MIFVAAWSSGAGEDGVETGQTALTQGAPTASEGRPKPAAIARGRSRGHDGAGHGSCGRSGGAFRSVLLLPGPDGWVAASSNPLGNQRPWYVFAHGYGAGGVRGEPCQAAG